MKRTGIFSAQRLAAATVAMIALASAATALAAGGEHHAPEAPSTVTIIATVVNFTIFAGLLIYVIVNKVSPAMSARRAAFEATAQESARLREEAQALVAQYQTKLDSFDQERQALLAEFRTLGEKERDRIIAEATDEASRIVDDARALAEREERHAERGIEAKLVERAVDLAVEELKKQANPMVQNRLIERSIDSFKAMKLN